MFIIGVTNSSLFFFSCRSNKSELTKTRIRCQEKIRANVASGVARVVAVVAMLPLSVTNLDVTSVATKIIMRGTVTNADVSSAMSPVINGLSVQQEHRGSLLVSGPVPPALVGVGRGMTKLSEASPEQQVRVESAVPSMALRRQPLVLVVEGQDHTLEDCEKRISRLQAIIKT